ncbi:MAG: hypothetical protein ABUK01_04655, partial [Leptospirales bacterium]
MWLSDSVAFNDFDLYSIISHVGAVAAALYGVFKLKIEKNSWFHALIFFIMLQFLSRLITPPELNINVSHTIWRGWESY